MNVLMRTDSHILLFTVNKVVEAAARNIHCLRQALCGHISKKIHVLNSLHGVQIHIGWQHEEQEEEKGESRSKWTVMYGDHHCCSLKAIECSLACH